MSRPATTNDKASSDARERKTQIYQTEGKCLSLHMTVARSLITQLDRPIERLLWILQHSMATVSAGNVSVARGFYGESLGT